MKRYKPIFEKRIQTVQTIKRYISLFEGKKQALQILKDKNLVNQLEKLDPTPTNKYIELFAKLIKNKQARIEDFEKLKNDIKTAEDKRIKIDVSKIKTLEDLINQIKKHSQKITKKQPNLVFQD